MAGRPIPDATNRSSHMRCPLALQQIRELGLKSCQQIARGMVGDDGIEPPTSSV
jgi:hypothetical protein